MKDYLLELVGSRTGFNAKLNIMREYLQAYLLRIMHEEGVFRSTAFVGGTALRFLHKLPRFSEDLDFSLNGKMGYSFVTLLEKIKKELILSGYAVSLSYNTQTSVNYAFVKYVKLMYEAGLSPNKQQMISTKIEIDTEPPHGAVLTTSIVNVYVPLSFLSYDLSSLFAGRKKVSAWSDKGRSRCDCSDKECPESQNNDKSADNDGQEYGNGRLCVRYSPCAGALALNVRDIMIAALCQNGWNGPVPGTQA